MSPDTEKLDKLSFEDALGELEEIVRDLESGKAPLDKSIASYERGVALKKHCEKKLKEAQTKIEKISLKDDGSITSEPAGENAS